MSYVLIDAGNSCLKISVIDSLEPCKLNFTVIDYPHLYEELLVFLKDKNPSQVLVSNVNSPVIFHIISDAIYKLFRIEATLLNVAQDMYGLSTRYSNPRTLGCDRWAAMIAARNEFHQTLCVVDCGTAVTIDVVSAAGMHLGGMITPGIITARKSLGLQASNLPLVDNIDENINNEASFLAINTQDAILGGTLYQLTAYIERIVAEIKLEFGENIESIITGGDADKIQALSYHHFHHREALVLDGLRVVAREMFNKDSL